ncbi:hypothetical protein VTO58DRAFT_100801 [Aureobasidium pullulans]
MHTAVRWPSTFTGRIKATTNAVAYCPTHDIVKARPLTPKAPVINMDETLEASRVPVQNRPQTPFDAD